MRPLPKRTPIAVAGLFSAAALLFAGAVADAQTTSRPCPYTCESAGLSRSICRDYRQGDLCFVERRAPPRNVICAQRDGTLRARPRCRKDLREEQLDLAALMGDSGPQGERGERGETGPQGPQGAPGEDGEDGALRIYGDGSAGARSFTASALFTDSNPQYTNLVIAAGVTLTVPSGAVLRCSGTFINQGTIIIQPATRNAPRFADSGAAAAGGSSAGAEALGGAGGTPLAIGVSRGLLRLALMGAGNGYRKEGDADSDGGGNFTVLCRGAVQNSGTIRADGIDASLAYRGGGAGGFVILASNESVVNSGTIEARGGDGGVLEATDATFNGHGPGGGGGGGIVHLIAPVVTNSGSVTVSGGAGGPAGGAGAITGLVYDGGGGGGGSGGAGGDGGTVNPGGIGDDSTTAGEAGDPGQIITTVADPASLY